MTKLREFTPFEQRQIREWVDLCDRLGPVPEHRKVKVGKRVADLFIDDINTMLCACEKRAFVSEMRVRNSGVVNYVDNICEGCEHMSRGLATIICATCRRVVMRLGPCRDAHGFRVVAGEVYHVERCEICSGDIGKSPIIEMLIWHRGRGIRG